MLTTNQKGAIAETAVTAAAVRLGIEVYRPVAEHGRYDMIFAFEHELMRVQCKWANRVGDVVVVRTYSCRRTATGMLYRGYTSHEIDAIAAYCAEIDRCFLLPAHLVCDRRGVHLRLVPPKNNQATGIIWASKYELGAIAQLGERPAGSREAVGSSPTSSIA